MYDPNASSVKQYQFPSQYSADEMWVPHMWGHQDMGNCFTRRARVAAVKHGLLVGKDVGY